MSATTKEWRRLAKNDPLFAVAAWPEKAGGKWTPEEFYAAGESDWREFRERWERYTGGSLAGACVEIGCGAGRITKALTQTFGRVVAVDVSEEMIGLAKAACQAEFHVVDDTTLPLPDASADAVFSCHVLQHLESLEAVKAYVGEFHRVLEPGGTVMLHLLLEESPPSLSRRVRSELRLRLVRLLRANRGAYSRVRRYRPDQVRAVLEQGGFDDVELSEFRVSSNGGSHAFWFARR